MGDRIEHFSHHHGLTLRLGGGGKEFMCRICGQMCKKGLVYSCNRCSFHIHKTCAELPQKINHHFHPQHPLTLFPSTSTTYFQCDACGEHSKYTYRCSQCNFDLDLHCAALMPTTTDSSRQEKGGWGHQNQINHYLYKPHPHPHPHPHPLILCETEIETDFNCSGCKLVIENGSIYVCIECKSILHKSCSELPQFIKHPFHPNHNLTFLPHFGREGMYFDYECSACGRVTDGFIFHCSECKFTLDINCAFLLRVISTTTTTTTTTNHHGHGHGHGHRHRKEEHQIDHPLILCKSSSSSTSKTKSKILFICKACQLPLDDDVYCCLHCHQLLHKSCAELPDEIEHHPLHPDHPLKLNTSYFFRNRECKACLRENEGFTYECRSFGCKFSIDIPCALSTPLLVNSQLHKHPLAFFSFVAKDLQCNICQRIEKSPYFRCMECNFNVHIFCLPTLPPTASDGNHRHPLTLTKSQVTDYDDEGEDAEFYCDRCENQRSLHEPTYYCVECHYVAHVHCVIQEVVRFMEEELSLAQKLGDEKLATSIDSCQANSNELVSRVLIEQVEETPVYRLTNTNLHEHPLTFFRVVVEDLCCIVCNSYSRSNFFRCVPCNIHLHLLCISELPPSIHHEEHLHNLTLTCSRVVDQDGDEDDEVGRCSACKQGRQVCKPTYYCAECNFVTHLCCALPELEMNEGESLAHELGDTDFSSSSTSLEENTNQVLRYVLINFSGNFLQKEDREEAITAIRVKIRQEEAKIEALRKKYIQKHEFKVDALWERLEALEKQRT